MKDYVKGILGGLIGGIIATIPWVLVYVYGNMMLSLLAILIGLAVLKGYQLFHGKVDAKLPLIIVVLSIISITIATFIFVPIGLVLKNGIPITYENVVYLYEYNDFFNAIIIDYIISLVFTFLGISGVIQSIKKQLSEGTEVKVRFDPNPQLYNSEIMKEIKSRFIKLNAMDKSNAVSKEEIFKDESNFALQQAFENLKFQQVIKKHNKKFYYSEEYEQSFAKRFFLIFTKILLIMIFIMLIIFLLITIFS